MDILEASGLLEEMLEKTKAVYVRTDPEVLDFTSTSPGKVIISGGQKKVDLEINNENARELAGFLDNTIFNKEHITTIVAWDCKSLFTYLKHFVPKAIEPTANIIDLHVIENFLGIQKKQPENLSESLDRAKAVHAFSSWKKPYKDLLLPLMLKVLPALENVPLLDEQDRVTKYAHYEIEGQTNGRLRCSKRFSKGYVPHTLGLEQKQVLKPSGYGKIFLASDIKHCEVSVLQWLSGDDRLGEIIRSGNDLYREIYKIITRDDCTTDNKRKLGKEIFLKVIYGIGSNGLAEELKVDVELAKELINRTYHGFPIATGWIKAKQNEAKLQGTIEDYFGRPRTFKPENSYLARNFVVQGVAATICLEKLCELHEAIQSLESVLCFSIHDGYGFVCPVAQANETYKRINVVMKEPSKLCPGLFLKAETKFGKKLDAMKVIGSSK